MTAFEFLSALGGIEDGMITELHARLYMRQNNRSSRKLRRTLRVLIAAAAIISALGITAYAVSSLHQRRQEELREKYKVQENDVTSFVEYPEPSAQPGVSLVSAISDGSTQYVYVNISPVPEELVKKGMDGFTFGYILNGDSKRMAGYAYDLTKRDKIERVQVYSEELQHYIEIPDQEKVYELILDEAYDRETQTLTLSCSIPLSQLEDGEAIELTLISYDEKLDVDTVFGTVSLERTQVQSREIIFNEPLLLDNPELSQQGQILGLTVYPTGADIYIAFPDAQELYAKDDLSREEYLTLHSWVLLMDKVYKDSYIVFYDGERLCLQGALGTRNEDGRLADNIQWESTIDINDIVALEIMGQRIELD